MDYYYVMRHHQILYLQMTHVQIEKKNAICLSISKPNKKMFLRKQKIDGYDLALLLISPDVLFMRKCLFFPYNAAAASSKFLTSEQRMGIEAFNSLFAERIRYQKSGEEWIIVNRENHLDTAETTSDQAEVQCLEQISPQHIMRKISFNIPLSYQDVQDMAEKLYLNPREYRNFYEYELNYPKPDDTESLEDMPF